MSQKRSSRFGFCVFPGYRWCGPGCSGPVAPINDVDAACKKHDLCYKRYGDQCACDRAFSPQSAIKSQPLYKRWKACAAAL